MAFPPPKTDIRYSYILYPDTNSGDSGVSNVLAILRLDAALSGSIDHDVEITEHPIEEGAEIADHRRIKPVVITLEGLVSDTPLSPDETGILRQHNRLGTHWSSRTQLEQGNSNAALDVLQMLLYSERLLIVQTAKGRYEDMTLSRLSVPLDPKTGHALKFSATFRKIFKVTNRTVEIQRPVRPASKQVGHKTVKPKPVEEQGTTIAFDTLNAISEATGRGPL